MELFASHCFFPTPDIRRTAEYYVDNLGFRRADYLDAAEKHICLYRDGVEFILSQSDGREVIPNRVLYGYDGDAYVIVRDQEVLQREYKEKGVNIVKKLHKTDYHNREFTIEDIDGRWIYFGIKEQDPYPGGGKKHNKSRTYVLLFRLYQFSKVPVLIIYFWPGLMTILLSPCIA